GWSRSIFVLGAAERAVRKEHAGRLGSALLLDHFRLEHDRRSLAPAENEGFGQTGVTFGQLRIHGVYAIAGHRFALSLFSLVSRSNAALNSLAVVRDTPRSLSASSALIRLVRAGRSPSEARAWACDVKVMASPMQSRAIHQSASSKPDRPAP